MCACERNQSENERRKKYREERKIISTNRGNEGANRNSRGKRKREEREGKRDTGNVTRYRIPLWGDFVIIPKDSLTRKRNKRRARKFFRCDAMLRVVRNAYSLIR